MRGGLLDVDAAAGRPIEIVLRSDVPTSADYVLSTLLGGAQPTRIGTRVCYDITVQPESTNNNNNNSNSNNCFSPRSPSSPSGAATGRGPAERPPMVLRVTDARSGMLCPAEARSFELAVYCVSPHRPTATTQQLIEQDGVLFSSADEGLVDGVPRRRRRRRVVVLARPADAVVLAHEEAAVVDFSRTMGLEVVKAQDLYSLAQELRERVSP
eukprot:PhM_4_TR15299/c0_g1_i1/m.91490